MITHVKRAVLAAVCLVLPLSLATAADAAPPPVPPAAVSEAAPAALPGAPTAPAAPRLRAQTARLGVAVGGLAVGTENRTGYNRDLFRHWNAGLDPADGCNTRNEVLIAEAVEPPTVGARCALTGGAWWSYYDEVRVTPAGALDIDHMVPLAEAWDSGAYGWTPARREAYANDQGQSTSLIAVTARSNRAKADQDPAQWLPPAQGALCRYAAEWTATKLRWGLTVDENEQDRLFSIAAGCTTTEVVWETAP
ncbi:HNH endonuclease family protein [Streptomyces yaizuensis]|uniref:HNH endonuclease family protein n=1 Tax=Streptomyces yaizuensis TaxID=2989713 RepID=A0ABQ5P1L8_9ACTN|nr:HNH endonuclease family protein [Streptomyces sp. YSPA8]GLF96498.1 HNH endonuclease family protein [Streptomyces sp. YSPA8]